MHAPGAVRDAIILFLEARGTDASADEIYAGVVNKIGDVARSSVRSYLNLNTPKLFERIGRGRYGLHGATGSPRGGGSETIVKKAAEHEPGPAPVFLNNLTRLYHADCFKWLGRQPERSIHAVVTDPPYGLVEYTEKEQAKLRLGRGGVWRIPPSFDGHKRAPLPRFTVLDENDREKLRIFFKRLAIELCRVTVPGANVVIASNPLLAHIVASAMSDGGLQLRGYIARLVMTMRGGDRPKNAHEEFQA